MTDPGPRGAGEESGGAPAADPSPREVLAAGWKRLRRRPPRCGPASGRGSGAGGRACAAERGVADPRGGLPVWAWIALAAVVGLALRLYYFFIQTGIHYPDEIFQYIEPAHVGCTASVGCRGSSAAASATDPSRLLRRPDGDRRGVRVARLVVARRAGAAQRAAHAAHRPRGIPARRAVGRGDERLGILSAFAMAAFPPFAYFAPHTLSEVHGLVVHDVGLRVVGEQVAFPTVSGPAAGVPRRPAPGAASSVATRWRSSSRSWCSTTTSADVSGAGLAGAGPGTDAGRPGRGRRGH